MIIGMAPGRDELKLDRPFVGPSGRLLWALAKDAGIDRTDCYLVNTIGEWPEGAGGGPHPDQYAAWWDRFDEAVRAFTGKVVMPLGGDALWRATGLEGGIEAWRGYLINPKEFLNLERKSWVEVPYKRDNKKKGIKAGDLRRKSVRLVALPALPVAGDRCTYIPSLHPAGVLRTGGATTPLLAGDLKKVRRALNGQLRPSRTEWRHGAQVFDNPPCVSVDIETGDATADFRNIERVGMADGSGAWTAPWNEHTRRVTKEILANPEAEVVIHNYSFDEPRLEEAGIPIVGKRRDSMFAAALLQPDLRKGLNTAASMYLDCTRWKHKADSDPALYNALDAIREYELWQVEKKLLEETGQLRLFTNIIMKGLPTLIHMGQTGIMLDQERREGWITKLKEEAGRLHREWIQKVGPVNFNSAHQLKKLFRERGMYMLFNKDGAESTNKEALRKLAAENPSEKELVELLLALKHAFKELSTYAGVAVGADGAVHPSFAPAFKDEDELGKGLAGTWRPTANSPNLQNQPKAARLMYVPRPGMVFVGADAKQLEARILAGYSGDKKLMEACDGDIHEVNRAKLNLDRVRAKNGFYGWGYLTSAKTLQYTFRAAGMNVPLRECEALLNGLDKEYSVAAGFRWEALARFDALGYVENGFGLRRYFPQINFPKPAAMATLIQSTGAMMMWVILPQLEQLALSLAGKLVLMVHDDVLLEVPAGTERLAGRGIKEIMEQEFPQVAPGFRVPVDLKWSPRSWGELETLTLEEV